MAKRPTERSASVSHGDERGLRIPALTQRQLQWRARYGPWAVVTGASDGIGRAMAYRLAEAGLNLVLVARRRVELRTLADDLAMRHGGEHLVLEADFGEREAAARVLAATQHLDVGLLVAAAGFGTSGNLLESVVDRELNMVDVNCRAVLALSHGFGRRLVQRRRGGIVLLSSLVAFQGVPRAASYAATKAYIQSLAEGLRLELASQGVDILASAPGPVRSGFGGRADMQMSMTVSPDRVARDTLRALGRKTTVRPGFMSKFLEASLATLPRWGRVHIMGLVMKGMTQHQHVASKSQAGKLAGSLHS